MPSQQPASSVSTGFVFRCGLVLLISSMAVVAYLLDARTIFIRGEPAPDNSVMVQSPPEGLQPKIEVHKQAPSTHLRNSPNSSIAPPPQDACASQWLGDKIVGRCFGLVEHSRYSELKHITSVDSGFECQSLCCQLQSCITWQYWVGLKTCKLGGLVRIGGELGDVANWCEPKPPLTWAGRRRNQTTLERDANTCGWNDGELTTQCFGLGPERNKEPGKQRLSRDECESECCNNPKCLIWQFAPDKGCFYDDKGDGKNYCDTYTGAFEGGRRCRPGVPNCQFGGMKATA
jgi:hypothetical protein